MKVEIFLTKKDEDFMRSFKMIREVVNEFQSKYSFKTLEINLVEVNENNYNEFRFYGHITVRINGEDIELKNDKNYSMEKRYYIDNGDKVAYIPSSIFKKAVESYIEDSITAQKLKGDEPTQIC